MPEPMVPPVCDHYFASHVRGGEPLAVRICQLCHGVDWADLREQVEALVAASRQEGRTIAAQEIEAERDRWGLIGGMNLTRAARIVRGGSDGA